MPGQKDDAHAPLADLLEDQVVSDQQSLGLPLRERARLIRRQLPGADQVASQLREITA